MPLTQIDLPHSSFSQEYHDDAFRLWYSAGKPNVRQLYQMLPDNPDGRKPSHATLHKWVKEEFMEKAMEMDQEVVDALQEKLIQSKVEMMERHVDLSRKMQEVGFKVLDENPDNISVGNAVRLIIEGVRIERESNGIPDMLRKMALMTDEQVIKTIEQLASKSPVEYEVLENDYEKE
jgi:hypothetical protein